MMERRSAAVDLVRALRPAAPLPLALVMVLTLAICDVTAQQADTRSETNYAVPDLGSLPDDAQGRLVRRGRDLVTATYAHIGPEVSDPAKRYAGNNLACRNCHLDAGIKRFGLPLWGVSEEYPRYDAEVGQDISIEQRVNGCMKRSMNGRAMPTNAPEMKAIVAYLGFLSTGVTAGAPLTGKGAGNMPELDRAADPARGRLIYAATCALCHGLDGGGIRQGLPSMAEGFAFPPLWGPQSFNDGAGMNRLITAANFIHANMPDGTSYDHPQLSVEEAWDVAAFVVAQPRPQKADLALDFPDRATKPVDTPYGPYLDGYSEQQHKFGPFGPIREALKLLQAETAYPQTLQR
ncbi:cystathionine gamma-synthase [Methylobacterium durans]|uniref:Cystathionine gamma-synthase n=2 Tax=Methylobacterium durans TaxID=2202825 RepID=A0A2U8WG92_9HYPH|nr:cystathionine gamma-synthase [Methylobacterium durans]